MDEDDKNLPRPTINGLPEQRSRSSADDNRKQLALMKLASHYWRPDASPEQAAAIIEDFLEDLSHVSVSDVERACMRYRTNAENRFFPTPGQLLETLKPKRAAWDLPTARLPRFEGYPDPVKPATKSVAQVLQERGYQKSADDWMEWKKNRQK